MPAPETETSLTLLALARNDDSVAWQRIAELYQPLIRIWCLRLGLSYDAIDDVSQQVLLAAWTGIDNFQRGKPGQSLRGWLYGITRNKAMDYFRSVSKRESAEGGTNAGIMLSNIPACNDLEDETACERDLLVRRILSTASRDYDEKNWQAFWLTSVAHLPSKDVALQLNMSLVAVRQAKYRILRRLRHEFKALGESFEGVAAND